MNKLLYEPKNSLVKQSFSAREIEEPLNGDGFGVGWYTPELGETPAVFVSTTPAWSNRNLKSLAPRLRSGCVFAHVRAASVGGTSEANCHPFHFGRFMMMHNGGVGGFDQIKRTLRRRLSDPVYDWLQGETDSQHLFALFLDKIRQHGDNPTPSAMAQTLIETVADVEAMKRDVGCTETSYLNIVVTDGKSLVATRFISSDDEEALSLYYSLGSRYTCENGVCQMRKADPAERCALIVSEKLTDLQDDWRSIPKNHCIVISEDSDITWNRIAL